MDYNFKNLVFEGGGVKGIAYLGALDVLAGKGILQNIKRIGGTSAGAINAILFGLGFSPDETKDILWSLDFTKFMDDSWGIVRDTDRLINDFGWYKGDFFREWIGRLIEEKTGNSESTFADIDAMREKKRFRSLYFLGTNLSTSFSEVFSAEHTPRVCVADAVRISMSIPLFLRPSEARAATSTSTEGSWTIIRLNCSTGKSISIPAITQKPNITGK